MFIIFLMALEGIRLLRFREKMNLINILKFFLKNLAN